MLKEHDLYNLIIHNCLSLGLINILIEMKYQ